MPVHDRTGFEQHYAGQPRWEIGRPQRALLAVADRITGSVLDSGCGTGGERPLLHQSGSEGQGIDVLAEPITLAKQKATERGLTATFLVMGALALKELPEVFDSVIDRGLFHVFSDAEWWRGGRGEWGYSRLAETCTSRSCGYSASACTAPEVGAYIRTTFCG